MSQGELLLTKHRKILGSQKPPKKSADSWDPPLEKEEPQRSQGTAGAHGASISKGKTDGWELLDATEMLLEALPLPGLETWLSVESHRTEVVQLVPRVEMMFTGDSSGGPPLEFLSLEQVESPFPTAQWEFDSDYSIFFGDCLTLIVCFLSLEDDATCHPLLL